MVVVPAAPVGVGAAALLREVMQQPAELFVRAPEHAFDPARLVLGLLGLDEQVQVLAHVKGHMLHERAEFLEGAFELGQ